MACWLIISSTPSSQPDSPLPMSGIDRWILSAEAFCLRKKFPRCISSALRTGVLLPPEDGFRQMIGSFGVVPLRRPHLRATVLIGQRSPRVAQPILYEDCAVCGVNRVELLTVGADRRLVIVALLGRHLVWYEHLNVPSTIGTAIPKWEQHDARSLAVRAGARLVFQPPTSYVPPFSVMIHHKSHVTDVQIRRNASLAFRTGPDRPARMVGVFCGDCGGAYQQHWLVGARLSRPTPLAAALVVVFYLGLLPCLTRRFLF